MATDTALAAIGATDLFNQPRDVPIPIPAGVIIAPSPQGRLSLRFEDVTAGPGARGIYYEVYMNMPAPARPDPHNPHYVGNLSWFGLGEMFQGMAGTPPPGYSSGGMAGHPVTEALDITDQVRDQQARGLWRNDLIGLTFVPVGGAGRSPSQRIVRIGRTSVVHTE